MRTPFILAAVVSLLGWGQRGPATAPRDFDQLRSEADLVVVAELVGTRDTGRRALHPGLRPPLPALEVESQFRVLTVLKGPETLAPPDRIQMRHYHVDADQWRKDHPAESAGVLSDLMTSAIHIRFLAGRGPYLLFLTRKVDAYEPASGLAVPNESIFALSAAGERPPPRVTRAAESSRSSSQVISPVAVATWMTRGEPAGRQNLEVIVLWRGEPGWFARGGARSDSSGGNDKGFSASLVYGDVRLAFEFEYAGRVATVDGVRIELADSNLILVDGVGTADGPRVVGTLRVDPARLEWESTQPVIQSVLAPNADVVSFLRCDAPMPGGRGQEMMNMLCARLKR